jgi:hypothetical protein
MCLKFCEYDLETKEYLKFQNTERLICRQCAAEVENQLRPTWQIVGKRIFPKKLLGF